MSDQVAAAERRLIGCLGLGLLMCGCAAQASGAAGDVTRQTLQQAVLPDGKHELRLMLIEYAPGVSAPAHRHPVAGTCYVLTGVAESQYEGEGLQVFRQGDSYQDYANRPHLVWRNQSGSEPLRFLCAAQIEPNQPFAEALE